MTHSDLVECAGKWLAKQGKCSVVITELGTYGETPDAIGWRGTHSILVECKTSRADFVADADKSFRRYPESGVGCHRFFLCLPGIISREELPAGWGLLEVASDKIKKVVDSQLFECDSRHEIGLLLSTLKRIGQTCPKGVSIRAYTYQTLNRATVGVEVEAMAEQVLPLFALDQISGVK